MIASNHAHKPLMTQEKRPVRQYLRYSTIGIEMGLSVIIGLLVGNYLDDFFGTEPWLLLTFLMLGLAAGFRGIFRLMRRMKNDLRQDEGDKR